MDRITATKWSSSSTLVLRADGRESLSSHLMVQYVRWGPFCGLDRVYDRSPRHFAAHAARCCELWRENMSSKPDARLLFVATLYSSTDALLPRQGLIPDARTTPPARDLTEG